MFINFNTEGINLYFLCPFVCFFCLVGASYAAGQSSFGKNAFIQNMVVSLGEMLAIIPHLLSLKIDRDTYSNSERRSLPSENVSSNNKKDLSIKLEYTNLEEDIQQISVFQILLLGFIDFLQSLCFFYGNYYTEYQLYIWSSHIFFLCLFTKQLLANKLYKHHFFSLVIFFCLDIIHNIFVILDEHIKCEYEMYIFLFISSLCFSFELVFEKLLMEKHFISIYKLCFLVGLSTFFFNLIISIIISIISSHLENKPKYFFIYSEYFDEVSQNIVKEILIIIIYMILTGLHNIFQFLTIKHLSPNHVLITQIMLAFYCSIMNVIIVNMDTITIIISMVFHSICVVVFLIFLEIIELQCCGMDYDTIHNINKRAQLDKYLDNLTDNESSEDSDFNNEDNND